MANVRDHYLSSPCLTTMSRVWVITGCTSGFGKEICISALARGDKVIATCRGNAQERLKDLIGKGADALSLDVAASPHEIQAFAEKAIAIHGHVDILCNNAGYVQKGALEEASAEETLKQYQTSVFGPLYITQAFLPHMRERKTGKIAMIGSRGAEMTVPGCGVYTSSKAALATLTQTLAAELEPFNIQATCIEPSSYRTEVFTVHIMPAKHIPAYEPVLAPTYGFLGPNFRQPNDPHKGAERIVDLLTGTGHAKGKKLPFRVALSDEAYETGLETMEIRGTSAKEWKEWSMGTHF